MANTRYIQRKDGKFAGSIGDGRDNTPSAAPTLTAPATPETSGVDFASLTKDASQDERLQAASESVANSVERMFSSDGWREWQETMRFFAKNSSYSANNLFLLAIQNMQRGASPDTTVMSAKNWKELGYHPAKGSSGLYTLFPRTKQYYVSEDGTKVPVAAGKKTPNGEEVHKTVAGYGIQKRSFAAYDVVNEEGKRPLDENSPVKLLEGEPVPHLRDTVTSKLTDAGFTVEEVAREDDPVLRMGANGYMDPDGKRVVVAAELPERQKDKTYVHEYAHAVLGHGECDKERGEKELEAESTAAVVMEALTGESTEDYSSGYLAGWSTSLAGDNAERVQAVKAALNNIQKTSHELLTAVEGKGKQ